MHPKTSDQSLQPNQLIDNHGRQITYLRLAITDRCNLRCRYCRPETGVPFVPHDDILTFEEFERIALILTDLGITKIRVTGGEPFSRRGCLPFLKRLKKLAGVQRLHITTNGVKTAKYLDELADIGINGINLSLDTLNPKRFNEISRRDYLPAVMKTMHGVLERNIPLKINSVVLEDTTDAEIKLLAKLAEKHPLTLRFIEIMPFSGQTRAKQIKNGNLWHRLQKLFPPIIETSSSAPTTARTFSLPGYQGELGIIEGYSRLFCKTCNKIRITPTGMLKTCLYDDGALDLKEMLRRKVSDDEIRTALTKCINNRFANGHAAEQSAKPQTETSMSAIGG